MSFTIDHDRFEALRKYYANRGGLITYLFEALNRIAENPDQGGKIAVQTLQVARKYNESCGPKPSFGHPYPEYLELPQKLIGDK